jgi:CRISPR/Cas system-associated exonuclease Cas4 (RecB family)
VDHFSITQLTTYLNCPAQYRYSYIENLPWEFQSADLVFGSVCHQVIAEFLRKQKDGLMTQDELVTNFEGRWEKTVSNIENLRFRNCDEQELTARGKRLMELYHEQFSGLFPQDVELFFELPMLDLATGQYTEQTIQGRIDLVAEEAVYELKTSSRSYNSKQADESLQLTFYSWAYQYLYGKPAKELKLIALVKTQTPKIQVLETNRQMSDFTRLYNLMTGVISAIEKGIFYPNPMSLYGCQNCQFQKTCKGEIE